uniref:Histidine-containing phosphotransfer protein n=1 Tax=Populus alba TaxID=43335 RepID=A0A4U5NJH4_POPAL|nr:histidine-containing phosphotransfer protein 1-like [Populus alba]
MGGSNVWQEQRNFVKSLHEQGILDSHFDEILDLPRESPQFVIDLVSTFCSDAENAIAALIRYLNEPDINYSRIIDQVHQIRGASSCIGGHRMALACRELRYACEDKDKDRCLAACGKTRDEYQILKEKFNIILQAYFSSALRKDFLSLGEMRSNIQ